MKVGVINLGCKVNQYEADSILKALSDRGHEVTENIEFADAYIINTCAITREAERKSRQAIARVRAFNKNARIIVIGCASQKDKSQFADKEGVVFVGGTFGKMSVIDVIENGLQKSTYDESPCLSYEDDFDAKSVRTRAYVKVQDGCNNFCSYCIVPYLRGRSRSRLISSVVKEVNEKAVFAHEVVLTGINLSAYGKDIGTNLIALLDALADTQVAIRLGSIEVNVINDDFLKATTKLKHFCPHFHLSMQSGSSEVLKSMNRHYTPDEYADKVALVRKYYPLANITTDVIVGFFTETDELFDETCAFVEKIKFGDMHIFPYSPREGTVSYKYGKPYQSKMHKRLEIIGTIRDKCRMEYLKTFIGKTLSVIIEEHIDGLSVGYSDNYIRTYTDTSALDGEVKNIKITAVYKDGLKGDIYE